MSNDTSGDRAAPADSPLDGRYRILSRLGSGGMADVYLAEDESLGRLVAIKVLKEQLAADETFVERFRIEAQAAASLSHPAIVAVYDRGKAGSQPYIAMELVRGMSLKQRLGRKGRLAPSEAADIALAVLSALQAAHERHIVHRDVTAANVLVDESGRVKVADFGIARMGESALTRTGAMLGTSSYLSPEQAQGRPADERSDLYSLGVVLFEMLTGSLPFSGESDVAVAMQHISAAPPNPHTIAPDVPVAYAGVVLKAMSKRPDDRYQTAAEFATALTRAQEAAARAPGAVSPRVSAGSPGAVPGESVAEAAPAAATVVAADAVTVPEAGPTVLALRPLAAQRTSRRRPWRWALLGLMVLAAAAGTWALFAFVIGAGPTVPGVVGRRQADAAAAVRAEELRPIVHQVWADKYDAGLVSRQRPRAGADAEKGSKVDLWVSRGPLHIPSPDLTGLKSSQAIALLEEQSLAGYRRRAATLKIPKGQIYRQSPQPGATVARGDTVTFWVSSGPPLVTVPNVIGLSRGDAKASLEAKGFTVNTDLVVGLGEVPGDVVDQDPLVGTRLRKGDEVVIKVAVL